LRSFLVSVLADRSSPGEEALARTDRALRAAVAELLSNHPAPGMLALLREKTHRGDALPAGRARRCYDMAVGILGVGDGREAAWWLREAREEVEKGRDT
jgi:hypothetical protein